MQLYYRPALYIKLDIEVSPSSSALLDHASTPDNKDPAPDARYCQKISVLSGNRTTSQQSGIQNVIL